ncbi:MAG: Bacitracin export ATP-binding protein BceA [Chlamydiae bacterium]|nr:Bacitracin export ATP-binding protein BceA [Chlamydiota bacterium]
MTAIECIDIKKLFGHGDTGVWALQGVDIHVEKGEIYMIVGPSGCGKTTLLSVIAGILDQTDGKCVVFDEDMETMSQTNKRSFRSKKIGFCFQSFNLMPQLTVLENVQLPLQIIEENGKERACEILEKVGLKDRLDFFPKELSIGQQQRVAIARALVHSPELILCDEPTSALDHKIGDEIMALLKELCNKNQSTLLVVTHDSRIFSYASRIAQMEDGKILKVVKQ